jgi:phosphatidylglycerol:prolipoprotein diacylglycerol transferase
MDPRTSYAAFMVLALVVFVVSRHFVPKPPALLALPWWQRAVLALAGFTGGALGAKLPFALGSAAGPLTVPGWLADGKTITTGLLCAYLAVEIAKGVLGIRVKTGDTFALPLALALAVGRWGCFFNGCCYGRPTALPWGVDFGDGVPRHPTQIYESLFHLALAGVLWLVILRDGLRWQRLKLYLIAYGVYRFLTEFIRPEPAEWLGLTFYQWAALVLVAGMTVQWLVDRPRRTNSPKPPRADNPGDGPLRLALSPTPHGAGQDGTPRPAG